MTECTAKSSPSNGAWLLVVADGRSECTYAGGAGVSFDEFDSDPPDGWAVAYLAGRLPDGGEQMLGRLFGLSPLPPGPRQVGMESAATFGRCELTWTQVTSSM